MNDEFKAGLAELSYKQYGLILILIFKNKYNISNREKILLYCLLHKALSMRQIYMMFCDYYSEHNAIVMVLHRLSQKRLIKKISFNGTFGYQITISGINECKRLIQKLFAYPLGEIVFRHENHDFALIEIIEYLSTRCHNTQPTYWQHYLAERDILAYLLRNECSDNYFEYETEVAISHGGVIEPLYNKMLLGVKMKYAIRSDGMLKYHTKRDYGYLKFLIEVDTGSQKSSLLSEKVQKYIIHYVNSKFYTPDTTLIFSINTDSSNDVRKRVITNKISVDDYHHALLLNCLGGLAGAMGYSITNHSTVGELVSSIEKLLENDESEQELEPLEDVIEYIRNKPDFFDVNSQVNTLMKQYMDEYEEGHNKKKLINTSLHQKRYLLRRSLLKRAIIDIPTVKEALLKGFSIYSVANYNLEKTFAFLHPEVMNLYNYIRQILSRSNLICTDEKPEYKLHKQVISDTVFLRNYYYFPDSKVSIIVENISDDIGGDYRIFSLLEEDTIPSMLQDTKLICLCDDHSIEKIKEKYLKTKLGKALAIHCNGCINSGFDMLFATYTDIRNGECFFSFSSDARMIKKTVSKKPN